MNQLITWLVTHGTDVVAALFAVHAAAVVIVKLTPTPKDDALLAKVLPWIEKVASILSAKKPNA